MYFNATALLAGILQFNSKWRHQNMSLHRSLGYLYLASTTIGAIGSLQFAFSRTYGNDNGFGAQVAFLFMALASLIPAWTAGIPRVDHSSHFSILHCNFKRC